MGNVRNRNRTTIITTDNRHFTKVLNAKLGAMIEIPFVNDIVSSHRGEIGNKHHSIRRISLLRRQFMGGYERVRIRTQQGIHVDCTLAASPGGQADDCSCVAVVLR